MKKELSFALLVVLAFWFLGGANLIAALRAFVLGAGVFLILISPPSYRSALSWGLGTALVSWYLGGADWIVALPACVLGVGVFLVFMRARQAFSLGWGLIIATIYWWWVGGRSLIEDVIRTPEVTYQSTSVSNASVYLLVAVAICIGVGLLVYRGASH